MPTTPQFGFTDYAQQLQNIERRRQLAQALFQQGMQPIENQPSVGGITVPNSPLSAIVKMAGIAVGAKGMKEAETKTEEVTRQRQADLVKALQSMGVTNPAVPQLLNMPETAPLGQAQIQMQMLKNALNAQQGNPMNPNGPNPSVMAGGSGMPPAPIDLLAAGDMGKTVYEGINRFNQPVNVRPAGTVYIPGQGPVFTAPQGGMQTTWQGGQPQMNAVPGATGALQATSEAEALGKTRGTLHNVTLGSGAQVPVLGANLGNLPPYYAGGAQHQAPQPPRQTADPWATMPKLQTPGGIGQTTFQKDFQAKQAENAGKMGEKFGTQADMSNQRIAYNNQSLELVDKAATGPLALQSSNVKNWLVSNFKIPEEDFKNTPSATIALNKDLLNAAAEKAKQRYGSRMTQSEVMLQIKQGAPNVDMTKAAIKYLLESDNAMAQYQIQQSRDFGRYINQGGDPQQFESWYARSFPMSAQVSKIQMRNQPIGGSVDDLVRKWTSPR